MRSTHSLFHGISYDNLAGISPYFFVDRFVRWLVSNFITYFRTVFLMLPLFYPIMYEGYTCDTISQRIFGVSL